MKLKLILLLTLLTAATATPRELPLPAVPDSLTQPAERADWLITHFWDAMDFADPAMCADSAMVEQTFANYLSVLPYASASARDAAVKALLDRGFETVMPLADDYLFNPASPIFSEALYLPFVSYAIDRRGEDWREAQRETAMKNMPGTPAPDIELTLPDGSKASLLDGSGRPVILMFYEPDCPVCHAALDALRRSPAVGTAVRLFAVYIPEASGAKPWKQTAAEYPSTWQIGIDADRRIDSQQSYTVRAIPTFYLIDGDGTVRLKDAQLPAVAATLGL